MSTIATLTVDLKAEVAQFKAAMEGVRKTNMDVKSSLDAMGKAVVSTVAGFLTFRAAASALSAIAHEGMKAEQSQAKLAAMLRGTGHAAGLTATDISALAEQMEASTLFDEDEIRDAASVLASFRTVAGDTFTETIRVAADLSSLLGGNLQSSIVQLGKALENPVEGLGALTKVGVTFTSQQKETIKSLVEQNRQLDAQAAILAAVRSQLGPVSEELATGITGAANAASDAYGDFLKGLAQTETFGQSAIVALRAVASALRDITPSRDKSILKEVRGIDVQTMALESQRDNDPHGAPRDVDAQLAKLAARKRELLGIMHQESIQRTSDAWFLSQHAKEESARVQKQIADERAKAAAAAETKRLAKETAQFWMDQQQEVKDSEIKWFHERQDTAEAHAAFVLDVDRALFEEQKILFHQRMDEAERVRDVMIEVAADSAQAFQDAAEESERAWARFGSSMQNLLEDSLAGQIRSLRQFAAEFLQILARMSAEAAAMQILKGVGGAIFNVLAPNFGAGGSGPSSEFSTAPKSLMVASPTINVAVSPSVHALDARSVAAYFEAHSPLIAAGVVQQLRKSGALEAALRGT